MASQHADVQPDVTGHEDTAARGDDIRHEDGAGQEGRKLEDVIAGQEEIFLRRQPESARMAARARGSLAGGVTSSWQITAPQAVWLSHGRGSKVYDVDGNEYVNLHGGYGAALAGHAHPAMVEAIGGPGRTGHPLRPAHRERRDRRRGAHPPVRPAAVAVRQLGHRGHHGRGAPDALDHRARPDHQGRRAAITATTTRSRSRSLRSRTRPGPPAGPRRPRPAAASPPPSPG